MRLLTPYEYECTGRKLAELQQWYEASRNRPTENERVKELTLRSLTHLIKQLKEEMIWYECHADVRGHEEPAATPISTVGGTSSPCTI